MDGLLDRAARAALLADLSDGWAASPWADDLLKREPTYSCQLPQASRRRTRLPPAPAHPHPTPHHPTQTPTKQGDEAPERDKNTSCGLRHANCATFDMSGCYRAC